MSKLIKIDYKFALTFQLNQKIKNEFLVVPLIFIEIYGMKTKIYFLILVLASIALLSMAASVLHTGSVQIEERGYSDYWRQIDSLKELGQPATAARLTEELLSVALKENNSPQILKAHLYRIGLWAQYEEDYELKAIEASKKLINVTTTPAREILKSITAELYYLWYNNHQWELRGRGIMGDKLESDFRLWDARTFADTIASYYLASMDDPEKLYQIKAREFIPILDTAQGSEIFMPTLLDLLSHRALEFFSNEPIALTHSLEEFQPDHPDFFSPANSFIKVNLDKIQGTGFKKLALQIYRQLAALHLTYQEFPPLIYNDLERIEFVYQNTGLSDKDSLYLQSLINLKNVYSENPHSTLVDHRLALWYYDKDELLKAANICRNAIEKYPETLGAKNCASLLNELYKPSLQIYCQNTFPPHSPILTQFFYKNTDSIFYRIYRYDERKAGSRGMRQEDLFKNLLSKKYLRNIGVKVIDPGDLKVHSTEIIIEGLENGSYFLLASTGKNFDTIRDILVVQSLRISGLNAATSTLPDRRSVVYVVDRIQGFPVADAAIKLFEQYYKPSTRTWEKHLAAETKTNLQGMAFFPLIRHSELKQPSCLIIFQSDTLYLENFFPQNIYNPVKTPIKRVYLFTDRKIYRPGQTLYYKGIFTETTGKQYQLLTNEQCNVQLFDANGKQIEQKAHKTNRFGSFSGRMTLPSAGLNGSYSLVTPYGSVVFLVEEYKRPNFEVSFESPSEVYKLGEKVSLRGKAIAYSGFPIGQAKVSYRVTRSAFSPYPRSKWWPPLIPSEETEICNMTTTTDEKGFFNVDFTAYPDPSSANDPKIAYRFFIEATIVDLNNETHEAGTSLSIGNRALISYVEVPSQVDKNQPVNFKIISTNLSGKPVNSRGTIYINRMISPKKIYYPRPFSKPDLPVIPMNIFQTSFPQYPFQNEDEFDQWEKGEVVLSQGYDTKKDSILRINEFGNWPSGVYRVSIYAIDTFGQPIENQRYFVLYDTHEKKPPYPTPLWFVAEQNSYEPGQTARFIIGSSEKNAKIFLQVVLPDSVIMEDWIKLSNQQKLVEIPVKERYRGNFKINLLFFKNNHVFYESQTIEVPYSNKKIEFTLSTFRSTLEPGAEETWQISLKEPSNKPVLAEVLANMYDASLDVFQNSAWNIPSYSPNSIFSWWRIFNQNSVGGYYLNSNIGPYLPVKEIKFDRIDWFGYPVYARYKMYRGAVSAGKTQQPNYELVVTQNAEELEADEGVMVYNKIYDDRTPKKVSIRKDFSETAFFMPHLTTDSNGRLQLKFKMPESLTRWKFRLFAHTQDMKLGFIEKEIITAKQLMVVSNAPRFLREGDTLIFPTKLTNMSDNDLEGNIRLEFFDLLSDKPLHLIAKGDSSVKIFSTRAGLSDQYEWKIIVPSGTSVLRYRLTAQCESHSDALEDLIPVLSDQIWLGDAHPLFAAASQTTDFEISMNPEILHDSRTHITFEFTTNPAWIVLQALPSISLPERQSVDAWFASFYANAIGKNIIEKNPSIRPVIEAWKRYQPSALQSNLQKNEDLKNIVLNETPWVGQAETESASKNQLADFLDENKMNNDLQIAFQKISQMQSSNGGFSWFEGMPDSRYITLEIVKGLSRLLHQQMIDIEDYDGLDKLLSSAVDYLDQRVLEDYKNELEHLVRDKNYQGQLSYTMAKYLYARSLLVNAFPIDKKYKESWDYYMNLARRDWIKQSLGTQALLAISFFENKEDRQARTILKSLRDRALFDNEKGLYWVRKHNRWMAEGELETQAAMIEAFMYDESYYSDVENMKKWLIYKKRTQNWGTSMATTEAVYALLLKGKPLLNENKPVKITVNGESLLANESGDLAIEAGSGYFRKTWTNSQNIPNIMKIHIENLNDIPIWGGMYVQYFKPIDEVEASSGGLKIEKQLFMERLGESSGPVLMPISPSRQLEAGNKVVVRLIVENDNDLSYVHLKDYRATGFEPMDVISGYRWQNGTAYYLTNSDVATQFFFEYLPRGKRVYEYSLRVFQKGSYSSGFASLQCLYAPEYSAHSGSIHVKTK